MGKRRNNNGVPVFMGSAAILFTLVFILSHFKIENSLPITDEKVHEQGTQVSQDSGKPGVDTEPEITSAPVEENNDLNEASETVSETLPEPKEPKPDPGDADNTWSMFLINSKNPVSVEYCESIETAKVYESWREYYMDSRMAEYLKQMINAAAEDGHQLIVMSAFRTIKYQQDNFDKSVQDRMDNKGMTYEEAYADTLKEVQLPGYSEHNAGVAADIMSDEYVSMDDDGFENTEAFKWLTEHAADYGFILRYPKGKESVTGIIYEPWHYRFVGVYYAKLLTDKGITMEEYFEEMNWVDDEGKAVYHIPEAE